MQSSLSLNLPTLILVGFLATCLTIRVSRTRRNSSTSPKKKILNQKQSTISDARSEDVFQVFVAPDKFKFNAAHFISYKGFRERLHGHNYSVTVCLIGSSGLGSDGYLLDFGEVKHHVGEICKELNEHFLLPMNSDSLNIEFDKDSCKLNCEDGSVFVLPCSDIFKLPIVHSSAEEIARYLWVRVFNKIGMETFHSRGILAMEISVAEMPQQLAKFRRSICDQNPIEVTQPPEHGCCN